MGPQVGGDVDTGAIAAAGLERVRRLALILGKRREPVRVRRSVLIVAGNGTYGGDERARARYGGSGMDAEQLSLLNEAVAAASRNDPAGYLEALAASHVLDGMIRGLGHKWPGMDRDSVYHAVAVAAADALYAKLASGGTVRSPAGYLWKAAENTLLKLHDERQQHDEFDETRLEYSRESPEPSSADRSRVRAEALRIARTLLPRLGEANIQLVMSFIFDCLEKGEIELNNEDIANATGLTAESVRRLKSRGFQRLRREARRAGIILDQGMVDDLADQDAESPDSEDTL